MSFGRLASSDEVLLALRLYTLPLHSRAQAVSSKDEASALQYNLRQLVLEITNSVY